jgi:hypothetical protein
MTTIEGRTGLGAEPNGVRIRLPYSSYRIGLVVSGVTRRSRSSLSLPSACIQAGGHRAQSLPTGRNRVRVRLSTPISPFRTVGSCRNPIPARPGPYR